MWNLASIPFRAETLLCRGARIDFTVGQLGIEIKTSGSAAEVRRQLRGYGHTGVVEALLLLTSHPDHLAVGETGYHCRWRWYA